MKRILGVFAVLALCVAASHVHAQGTEHHKRVKLETMNGSGISGWVNIVQLPQGGSNLVVTVQGLKSGDKVAVGRVLFVVNDKPDSGSWTLQ